MSCGCFIRGETAAESRGGRGADTARSAAFRQRSAALRDPGGSRTAPPAPLRRRPDSGGPHLRHGALQPGGVAEGPALPAHPDLHRGRKRDDSPGPAAGAGRGAGGGRPYREPQAALRGRIRAAARPLPAGSASPQPASGAAPPRASRPGPAPSPRIGCRLPTHAVSLEAYWSGYPSIISIAPPRSSRLRMGAGRRRAVATIGWRDWTLRFLIGQRSRQSSHAKKTKTNTTSGSEGAGRRELGAGRMGQGAGRSRKFVQICLATGVGGKGVPRR